MSKPLGDGTFDDALLDGIQQAKTLEELKSQVVVLAMLVFGLQRTIDRIKEALR